MVLRSARTLDAVLEQYALAEAARAGRTQAELADVSAEQLLRGVCAALEACERAPAVSLEPAHADFLLRIDPALLERALVDLALEAIRRLSPGARVHLTVTHEPGEEQASCRLRWDDGTDAEGAAAEPMDAHALAVRAARAVLPVLGGELELAAEAPELLVRLPLAPGGSLLAKSTSADRPADATDTVPSQAEPGGTP